MTRLTASDRRRHRSPALAALLLAATTAFAGSLSAAELPAGLAADFDRLLEAQRFHADGLAVSPDGRWAVASVHTAETHYVEYLVGIWRRILVLVDLASGGAEVLTAPEEDAHAPVWIGGSTAVAFVARRDGRPGIDLLELDGRHRRRLVEPAPGTGRPIDHAPWIQPTADGRYLLYALQHGVPWWEDLLRLSKVGPAELPETPIVIGPDSRAPLLRALGMKGEFFAGGPDLTIHAVPAAGGEAVELASSAGLPKGPYLGPSGLLDARWDGGAGDVLVLENGRVRRVALGEDPVTAADGGGGLTLPGRGLLDRSLPDGRTLLLTATEDGAWETVALTRSEDGGLALETRARAPALEGDLPLLIGADGHRVLVRRVEGPGIALLSYDLTTGKTTEVLDGRGVTRRHATPIPGRDEALVVRTTPTTPEHLLRVGFDGRVIADLGTWPGVPADLPLGVVERFRWTSDEEEIEGLLVTPDDGGRGRPYPTLVYLHGGPDVPIPADLDYLASGRSQSAAHLFARAGYAVLIPYFRGTGGYGDRFEGALGNGRLYSGPAADCLAGVDALVARGLADPERLGIYGHSFGGMLTAWMVARDHRFKAAISAVGTLDSLHQDRSAGSGDHAFHAMPGLGGPDDDLLDAWKHPERYRELSPLEGAWDVTTPMLFVTTYGEERHLSEYAAFFNALRLRDVPTLWLHFPGAYHTGSWSLDEQRAYVAQAFAWFEGFVRAPAPGGGEAASTEPESRRRPHG